MSQNHHLPSSACAAFARLLPLASHDLLSEDEDTSLRAHLATCAHCRAALADYDHVEAALRSTFAPRQGAVPPFSREEIMQILDHHDDHPVPVAPPVPALPQRRPRRLVTRLAALAAVLVLAILTASIFSIYAYKNKTAGPAQHSTVSPTPVPGSQTSLADISMVSATEGWAVGETSVGNATHFDGVLMHYQNGAWSRVNVSIKEGLNSISMISATDGWAVGDAGLILHYDGQTWKQATSAQTNLHRIQMLSATEGWAVGEYTGFDGSAIWHYNGHTWTPQPLPASLNIGNQGNWLQLFGLSMLSPTEGWAAGSLVPNQPGDTTYPTIPPNAIILHYTGGQWVVDKIIQGATLRSVSMSSADDGWAAGENDLYVPSNAGEPHTIAENSPLLLHYKQGQWVQVASPLNTPDSRYNGTFSQVALRSASDGWLVGGSEPEPGPTLFHYDGTTWRTVKVPTIKDTKVWGIYNLAMTSATEGWGVGLRFTNSDTVTPVILHYLNGTWSVYQS